MSRWSVHVLVVLFTLVLTGTVNGGYLDPGFETGVDGDRRPIGDQIMTLIQKIDKQEERLQTLEITVTQHTHALAEKDRRIGHLEQELADMKLRVTPVQISVGKTTSKDREIKEKHQHESATNQMEQGQLILDQTRPSIHRPNWTNDKPAQHQRIRITDHRKDVHSVDSLAAGLGGKHVRKLRKPEAFELARATGIRQTQTAIQHEKRVDNTPPNGHAFSLSLSVNTNVVPQSIIQYDDVMLDTGNGYNHGNGIYEVPASGVYVFTWSIRSGTNNGGTIFTQLMVNGVVRSATLADSDSQNWVSATGLIVTSVNTGDHVYIRSMSTGQVISYAGNRSTFSGWRLF